MGASGAVPPRDSSLLKLAAFFASFLAAQERREQMQLWNMFISLLAHKRHEPVGSLQAAQRL
jgi:hypothetical protein